MQTLAAISRGASSPFALETVELDDPRPDELLVRIEAVGLCHTDLAVRGMWPEGVPLVLGHEGAGVVERVGADVTDAKPGDKVIVSFASCGACERCASGLPGYCVDFRALNISGSRADGSATLTTAGGPLSGNFFGQSSFAQHALTARRNAVVVDPSVDLALIASFGCGAQTGAGAVANVLQPTADGRLVVFGLGGVGMAALMAAAALGVRQVVGVDLSPSRRQIALQVGATDVVDGADADVLGALREVTGGGASHALDTTGVPAVVRTAAQALRPLGALVVIGNGADFTLDHQDIIGGGKTVRGSIEGDADPQAFIPQLVTWYQQGRMPMDKIVRTFALEQIEDAVAQMKDGSAVKPVLLPHKLN
jgi:aryl-alcohol dehydrogenase